MKKLVRYESFIFFGILMVVLTLVKLFGVVEIDSDWFWFVAGVALVMEGAINLGKQRQFDRKYKVILRE